jgi:hypothetical protein
MHGQRVPAPPSRRARGARRLGAVALAAAAALGASCGGDGAEGEVFGSPIPTVVLGDPGPNSTVPPSTAPTTSSTAATTSTTTSLPGDVFALEPGVCFDDPGATQGISDVPIVPCTQAHSNEVIAVFELAGAAWPGEEPVQQQAESGCLDRFTGYVGSAYENTDLVLSYLYPNQQGWEQIADREVVCYVYRSDGGSLTGTVQGSGL